jgi:DNA-binding GntR family transcriptional regulator
MRHVVNDEHPEDGHNGQRRSLYEIAYAEIRDMLITTRIPPGAPVREDQLTRELGVGRTPVREAIKRLESERLVNVFPRRGVFATEVQLRDLALLTEVRVHLEGQAAFLAATRANAGQRAELRALLEAADARGEVVTDQIGFDIAVHRTVYRSAGNAYLEATLTQYYNLILRIWHVFIDRLPEMTGHVGELTPVLESILAGEEDGARKLMIDHIKGFERAVLSVL